MIAVFRLIILFQYYYHTLSLCILYYPIGSMYAIYGNIYHQYTPKVSIYTIHGSYGYVLCIIVILSVIVIVMIAIFSIGLGLGACLLFPRRQLRQEMEKLKAHTVMARNTSYESVIAPFME